MDKSEEIDKSSKVNKEERNYERNVWTDECEELLAEWSEKASCYRWLHGRCEKSYRTWYYCFSIPVIILSTLTGAANVGMDSFVPTESKSMASAIVGGVNIFAGIVSTLQNFLKVAELMEGHRIAGVSWGKLQRNISIELALDPSRRVLQTDFLKLSRAEYDRLIEAGPIIDDGIIKQFNKKFQNYEVSFPSICNGLDKCNIYKIDPNIRMDQEEFNDGIEDLVPDDEMVLDRSNELLTKDKEPLIRDEESLIKDEESLIKDEESLIKDGGEDEIDKVDKSDKSDNSDRVEVIIKFKEIDEVINEEDEVTDDEVADTNSFLEGIEEDTKQGENNKKEE